MTSNGKTELHLPDLSAQQLILGTVIVGLVILGFWLVFRFYEVILLLMAGIVVSLALKPAVDRLKARGVPPAVAVGLLYGVMLIVAILFLRFGAPLIANQTATIGAQLGEIYASMRQSIQNVPNLLIQRLAELLPPTPALPQALPADVAVETDTASTISQAMRYVGLGSLAIFHIGAIFLIAFFWTIESERIIRSGVGLLPLGRREAARDLIGQIEQRVGGYVAGQLLLSLIIGALSMGAYFIIGLPYAPVLGLFVGIMEIIPVVGPLIGAVPALVIGFSISPLTALWTVLAALIIHQLEANVLSPRVMRRTLGMRPLVTLLALTAFGTLFGILGALIALPLAAVLQLLFDRFLVDAPSQVEQSDQRDSIGLLRYETQEFVEDVRKVIRRREDEDAVFEEGSGTMEDRLEAIALDLDSLLSQIRRPGVGL
ncbi:MAG: AI-2E family transporter [Anaerolineae bacterium]|uniref:AI-2E family transporter n=1 Tax=Promineifilum sp. TaxID=2664178 RepID=UPI001D7BDCF2|nr:AI-2E family transporter [Anaerolineales bacterium]MCB8935414.1 AI-2E family transporter [Promineifilum sp.]MCO5181564.1 AI-2E family transporter [Promineifilum sp.]MCW5846479.1 AI-2E family transporter [Anaerolineae bacterium]